MSASKGASRLSGVSWSSFKSWALGPTGLKTTHAWGPISNAGLPLSGLADLKKHPEYISENMTLALCVYSLLFMRFAWRVQPRNYLLLGVHMSNELIQMYQLQRIFGGYDFYAGRHTMKREVHEQHERGTAGLGVALADRTEPSRARR